MPVDDIYLENIDEYVKDERKLVTYKWLSLTLQVHCNTAKQMLYKYLDTERNTKNTTGLNVTYFVSGLTKSNDNGEQAFKCSVVPEEKLESVKSTLDVLTSCHVYSIQMTKLKDSNALYMTDFEKFKENPFELNKYSSIQYERAQPRSADEMSYMTIPMEEEKKPAVRTESNKPAAKKQPQSALQSMFSKADATKKSKETAKADTKKPSKDTTKTDTSKKSGKDTKETKPAVKAEPKESNKTNKKAGGGGMMSFFSKDTGKAAKAAEKPSKHSPKKKSPVKEEPVSKKKAREDDSDEEVINRSKRRRTGQDLFDSDSEEEDMEAEEEAPIPPTPPRQASPDPEVIDSSPEVEEETEDPLPTKTTSKTEESSKSSSGTKRRIKKRKQVDKTYMDDAGFMVTEKVYEEVSTDASECDEPVKKVSKKQTTTKSPNKGKKSPKKTSPGKKGGQGAGKQTNLMSFFKKK